MTCQAQGGLPAVCGLLELGLCGMIGPRQGEWMNAAALETD
jgi:hypothetical protein